jgi:hypothetical protein
LQQQGTVNQSTNITQNTSLTALQRQVTLIAANPALQIGPFVSVDPNPENGVVGPHITWSMSTSWTGAVIATRINGIFHSPFLQLSIGAPLRLRIGVGRMLDQSDANLTAYGSLAQFLNWTKLSGKPRRVCHLQPLSFRNRLSEDSMSNRDLATVLRIFYPELAEDLEIPADMEPDEVVAEVRRYLRSHPQEVE